MPTPAHTDLDSNNPQATQSPTNEVASTLNNIRALRDSIVDGIVPGFIFSRSGGTANQPQYAQWLNSTLGVGFRWNITWTGFQLTSVVEEWTNDNAASWTVIATIANTYDGSYNITGNTLRGGMVVLFWEIWSKCLKVVSDQAAHAAATGVSVHGLGTMSTQADSGVDINGGTIDGTDIGQTAQGKVDAKRAREQNHDYGTISSGGTFTPEADKYAYVKFTAPSPNTATFTFGAPSGAPASGLTQTIMVEMVGGQRSADGKITYDPLLHLIGGAGARPLDTSLQSGTGSDIWTLTWNGTKWLLSYAGGVT